MFALKKIPQKTYVFEEIFKKLILQLETLERASENIYEIIKTIVDIVSAKSGSLFLFQPGEKLFVLKKWVGDKPLNMSVSGEYEFISYLKQVLTPVFKDSVLKESRYLDVRSAGIHYFTQLSCVAAVPLIVKNEWIGLLNIGRSLHKTEYNDDDRNILILLGYWLAHNISNVLLYDEVQRQNKKLSLVAEMKNELMANVTHELKTPLNGILGLTDILIEGEDGSLKDDQRRHLEMIKSAGESLLDIVNNILSLIKIESGKGTLTVRKLEISRMVGEISSLFEGLLASHENHFCSHVANDFTVYGDEDQVRTIFMNLLGNAVKFTRQGQIEVYAHKSGDMARLCIKDTGIGIAEADQFKIFEEFRQADGSLARAYGGTGLGLAIAKKIVELHGGRIWVDSVVGKGSEFYFTLPLKPV